MSRRRRKPPGITIQGIDDTAPRPAKLFRRLRVVAEPHTPGGVYPMVRDVYLESSHCPFMVGSEWDFGDKGNITCEMLAIGLSIDKVADLIRFMEAHPEMPRVIYDPPGNMAGYLRPKRNGQRPLFE